MRTLPQIIEDMFRPVVNDTMEGQIIRLQIKLDKSIPISKMYRVDLTDILVDLKYTLFLSSIQSGQLTPHSG